MRRSWKVALSFVCLLLSGSLQLATRSGYRIRADERLFATDINAGLATGHVSDFYLNGKGFQAITVAILRLTDLPYTATELLSPLIGGIVVGLILAMLLKLYDQATDDISWWEPLPVLLAVPALPGLVNRLRETSHKAYTYLLVLGLVYLAVQLLRKRRDQRFLVVISLFVVALTMINWIWGVIYTGYVGATLVGSVALTTLLTLGTVLFASFLVAAMSPIADTNGFAFFERTIQILFDGARDPTDGGTSGDGSPNATATPEGGSGSETSDPGNFNSSGTSGDDSGEVTEKKRGGASHGISLIEAWRPIRVGPVTVSSWFVAWSSVLFAGLTTAIGNFVALVNVRSNNLRPLSKLTLVTSGFFGLLVVLTVVGGSIATAKRLIVIPGMIGILYATLVLSESGEYGRPLPDLVARHRRELLFGFTAMLALTTIIGTYRMMLDGTVSPHDFYASANQVTKIQWMGTFDSGCLAGTGRGDAVLASELLGEHTSQWTDVNTNTGNVVYDSGEGGKLVYQASNETTN